MAEDDTPDTTSSPTNGNDALSADTDTDAQTQDEHEDHDEDEGGGALASRVLGALALMAAGGAIALWLGPKIAPKLPAGLAPVAAWLTPGGEAAMGEVAALRADLDARLAALPAPRDEGAIRAIAAEVAAEVAGATDTGGEQARRIAALEDRLQALENANAQARIAALESEIAGLRGGLDSLTRQISEATFAGGELNAEALAQVTTYKAALDGMQAELDRLAAQNGALSQRLEEVAATAERQVNEAASKAEEAARSVAEQQRAAAITSAMDAIGIALASGADYSAALATLEQYGVAVPEGLRAGADGVVTLAELQAAFPAAAHAAIRADARAQDSGGGLGALGGFLKSRVATRSLDPQEGDSADAIQSRAEAALRQDDLAVALDELAGLPVATPEMDDWIALARTREQVTTAYAALSRALSAE